MKMWNYKELRDKNSDELLDLLSDYLGLKNDIINIIENDKKSEEYYYKEFLMYYDINITKIKNELEIHS